MVQANYDDGIGESLDRTHDALDRWHDSVTEAIEAAYRETSKPDYRGMAAAYRRVATDLAAIAWRIPGDSYLHTVADELSGFAAVIEGLRKPNVSAVLAATYGDVSQAVS